MRYRWSLVISIALICCLTAAAKNKKKVLLTADVLDARTVLVVIDPDAGIDPEDPNANRAARQDVERALMSWGRFSLAMDVSTADLVISLRKGNGKMIQPTIGGVPDNNRPVIFDPSDSGVRLGGHSGTPPQNDDPTYPQTPNPHQQVEVASTQDMFVVYRGKQTDALNTPAVWRYNAKDALRSPDVPAVDAFRRVILEAEKQRDAKP